MKRLIAKPLTIHILLLSIILFGVPNAMAETRIIWEELPTTFQLEEHYDHPRVQEQIKLFTARPHNLRDIAIRSEPYVFYVYEQVKARGMPGELILLPKIESAYDPFAFSHAGASGLWQIMPTTGSGLGLLLDWWYDGRRDVTESTRAALDYLSYLNDRFDDDWLIAIAAYQAGEGTVSRAIQRNRRSGKGTDYWSLPLPRSTRIYVPKLLAIAVIIKNPKANRAELPSIPYQPYFAEVEIDKPINLQQLADLASITLDEFLQLNPGYNNASTNPGGVDVVIIPLEKAELLETNLLELSDEDRMVTKEREYTVKRGDTLGKISKNFNTSVNDIKRANNLRSDLIREGQKLHIPGGS